MDSKPVGVSWRRFGQLVREETATDFTYDAFRHWHRAELLPPLEVVDAVRRLGRSLVPIEELVEDNWGQRKGGQVKTAIHGSNLDTHLRRKGGQKSAECLKVRMGEEFNEYWKTFSSRGGLTTLIRKTSLLRKVSGPAGEKMFNEFEATVAKCLSSVGVAYSYEPRLEGPGRTTVPDFIAGNFVIECTSWSIPRPRRPLCAPDSNVLGPSCQKLRSWLSPTTDCGLPTLASFLPKQRFSR